MFLRAGQMAELDARRTEVRNKAARAIQSRFRTHIAREKFLVLRKSSVYFQSFVRGKVLLVSQVETIFIAQVISYTESTIIYCSNIGL